MSDQLGPSHRRKRAVGDHNVNHLIRVDNGERFGAALDGDDGVAKLGSKGSDDGLGSRIIIDQQDRSRLCILTAVPAFSRT